MYRKTRDMLIIVALTMSMLLAGIGPVQASGDDDGGPLGLSGLLGGRDGEDGDEGYDDDDGYDSDDDDDDDDDGNNCLLGILCIG